MAGIDITSRTPLVTAALLKLAKHWIKGELSEALPPEEFEQKMCMDYLTKLPSPSTVEDEAVDSIYNELIANRVQIHFCQAASHRKWIRLTYKMLFIADSLEYGKELEAISNQHDLSKYGPWEAKGYGIMFGKTGKFQKLEDPSEKAEWEGALQAHYNSNKHHPQYYKDGESMSPVHLEESIIDIIACRLEREMTGDTVDITKLLDFNDNWLGRYMKQDREIVDKKLTTFKHCLESMTKDPSKKILLDEWQGESGKCLIA